MIGARQNYLKAIVASKWQGFACGLDWKSTQNKAAVQEQLALMFDLIEHEAQHHGQLVRYLYGQKILVPATWKKRYNLD